MGFAIVAGGNPSMAAPVTGIAAGDIAVGSTVKLMESGTAVEYLVVNQGIPSSSNLYDSSCDGTWLLRNSCLDSRTWNVRQDSGSNGYASSTINTWLNGDFCNTLGSAEQAAVKQVKIPYCTGSKNGTVNSGVNGLSVKAFLLSSYEVGWTSSDYTYCPQDGAKLDYFIAGTGGNSKRVAPGNVFWWLRSQYLNDSYKVWCILATGGQYYYSSYDYSAGIRPALVLSKTAIFDADTMILKGAA